MRVFDYHGDDYAVSPNNSRRMLELIEKGKLNSISIIPNMSYFDECMSMLEDSWDLFDNKPLVSIHLNLIDGLSLSKQQVNVKNQAIDVISNTWIDLFKVSFGNKNRKLRYQRVITEEIKCQINRVMEKLPDDLPLRLDSHVHTHMIPFVFDAMMDAVNELNMMDRLEFVRNSKEPLFMFLTTPGIVGTIPLVNIAKNIILNLLSIRVEKVISLHKLPITRLWGLNMSGYMDSKRVNILSKKMRKYVDKHDCYMEVLCHPGIALESEIVPEYGKEDVECFFSKDRDVEYDMILSR